jgi:hypothetical protein
MRSLRCTVCALILTLLPVAAMAYHPAAVLPVPPHPVAKCPPQLCQPGPGCPPCYGWLWPCPAIVGQDPATRTRLFGKAGPLWMTENVDFPFYRDDPANPLFALERLSLSLDTESFWAGFVKLELDPFYNVTLYGEIGGVIPKNGTVHMDATGRAVLPAPDNAQNLVSPWVWKAKDIHWWMVEGGAVLWLAGTLGLDLGFRDEHMDYQMTEPHNFTTASAIGLAAGLAPGFAVTCGRI